MGVGEIEFYGYAGLDLNAKRAALPVHEGGEVAQDQMESSSNPRQRAIAGHLLGYARQSRAQIAALVRASRDADSEVRNNATRALWVLAASGPKTAARIPADAFIEMLYSRSWTDRNKAGNLLEALTRSRDPQLLRGLCEQAEDPLLEMAHWRDPGHAYMARMILGRCAGIDEARCKSWLTRRMLEGCGGRAQRLCSLHQFFIEGDELGAFASAGKVQRNCKSMPSVVHSSALTLRRIFNTHCGQTRDHSVSTITVLDSHISSVLKSADARAVWRASSAVSNRPRSPFPSAGGSWRAPYSPGNLPRPPDARVVIVSTDAT